MNAAALELLLTITQQFAGARIILAGVIGPTSDGYATDEALSANAAFAYHRDQADVLEGLNVTLLYAPTFPAFSELSGAARAMAETGRLALKKCYNFRLAMLAPRAAYCVSQRTATLLLVVHYDSQVVCAAVHKYSHLIGNLNPPSPP